MNSNIAEAKAKLPLLELMTALGLREHAKSKARCPFHEDTHASFSTFCHEDHWFWKCHAGCGAGDEINLLEKAKGISRAEATKLFVRMAGVNGHAHHLPARNEQPTVSSFNWQACVAAFNAEHVERLNEWRGYSPAFCAWLHKRALVGLYRDCIAFPITDNGKIVAAHYRLRDGSWRVFPHGVAMRPFVIGNAGIAKIVHVFESQWDLLAIAENLALQDQQDVALIATRGASNGKLIRSVIRADATVFAWKQNDKAGEAWLKDVAAHAGAAVQVVTTPCQFKDANDWSKAGVTVDDLVSALDRAAVASDSEKIATAPTSIQPSSEGTDSYFDAGRNMYWIRNQRGSWIALNETQFKRVLRQRGVSPKVPEGAYVSALDESLIDIQQRCDVHYAGALAGYKSGVYDIGERRILVTESPSLLEAKSGDWQTLQAVISGLLGDAQFDQAPYLYGWLKVAFETLRAGGRRPGQALVLAGVHGCGKSLLQTLITGILGGRSARPYQFMSGLTPFNSDLFEAEHLVIEDEQASTDIRARRNFGAQLKNITVVDSQRCHAKNRVAITLTPFWRLSVTVNDEPENLMVLPPIDDSIEDKLIILRASRFEMPMPTATLQQRNVFWNRLESELPAFLDWLAQWAIPPELSSERFGIMHFHHPEILQAIDNLAPEFRLLRLIDDELFDSSAAEQWEGTAEQLERRLCSESSQCRSEARKLFTYNTACGVYLGRLLKKEPKRFDYGRESAKRLWTICPAGDCGAKGKTPCHPVTGSVL